MMPDRITEQMVNDALMMLGIENPEYVTQITFGDNQLSVIRVLHSEDGSLVERGGRPVFEASTYDIVTDES